MRGRTEYYNKGWDPLADYLRDRGEYEDGGDISGYFSRQRSGSAAEVFQIFDGSVAGKVMTLSILWEVCDNRGLAGVGHLRLQLGPSQDWTLQLRTITRRRLVAGAERRIHLAAFVDVARRRAAPFRHAGDSRRLLLLFSRRKKTNFQIRATLKYIQDNQFPAVTVFRDNRPHYYRRDEHSGIWTPVRY